MSSLLIMGTAKSFCGDTKDIWQFIGNILTVLKILIPVGIIALGMVDLGKAVIASDDKAIKSAGGSLAKRFAAGIIIFFIPVLVKVIFNLMSAGSDAISDAKICINCVTGDCNAK